MRAIAPAATREAFTDITRKAAADTRAHGLAVEKEALAQLKDKGVTIIDCDREAFRKRVLPQSEAFVKTHPDAKPVVVRRAERDELGAQRLNQASGRRKVTTEVRD